MEGLHQKYRIEKTDGTPVDPEAEYLVLRLDTDDLARSMATYYALAVQETAPQFGQELMLLVQKLEWIAEGRRAREGR